ncbi:MAG: hypothetical protein ACRCSS_22190 [Shewanella sp.]
MNTPTNQPNRIETQHPIPMRRAFTQHAFRKEIIIPATREQKSTILTEAAQSMALQVRSRNLISTVLIAAMDWINDPTSDLVGTTIREFADKVNQDTGYQRTSIYRYFDNMSDIVTTVLTTLKESSLNVEALTKKERALIDFYGI